MFGKEDKPKASLIIAVGEKKPGAPPPLKPLGAKEEPPAEKTPQKQEGYEETMEQICEKIRQVIAPELGAQDYQGILKALNEHLGAEPEEGVEEESAEKQMADGKVKDIY